MATINLSAGNDTPATYSSNTGDTINGLAGNDVLTLGKLSRTNTLNGGDGNDTLAALAGATGARLVGGNGDDSYLVNNASDIIVETANGGAMDTVGTTLLSYTAPAGVEGLYANRNDTKGQKLTGNSGYNQMNDGLGSDTLNGAGGDDEMVSIHGNDILIGGSGSDGFLVLQLDKVSRKVTVSELANGGIDTVETNMASFTLGANVEHLYGNRNTEIAQRNQTLTGNNLGNTIRDGTKNDIIRGLAGNDTLDSEFGNDRLEGGTGNDLYQIVGSSRSVTIVEASNAGTDKVVTDFASFTLSTNVENLTGTNNAGQTLTGNASNNVIQGAAGKDTLTGGKGNDTYILNGTILDTIVELSGGGSDTVSANVNYTLSSTLENLVGRVTGLTLNGNGVANKISTKAGGSSLFGLGGDDTIAAGGAGNLADGGIGDDNITISDSNSGSTANGGEGNDAITVSDSIGTAANGGAGNDTISVVGSSAITTLAGGIGNDRYNIVSPNNNTVIEKVGEGTDSVVTALKEYDLSANVENLTGTSKSSQRLYGNELKNIIKGGSGNDRISGELGADTLTGGKGADKFHYETAAEGKDIITDFAAGDKFELRAFQFGLKAGPMSKSNLVIGTKSIGTKDYFIFDTNGDKLYYDADAKGTAEKPVLIADLNIAFTLTVDDFILI